MLKTYFQKHLYYEMVSVDELTDMIKNSLSRIQNIKVSGEIGKIMKSSKQHLYFELKSKNAIVSCVAWASSEVDVKSGQAEVLVRKMDFYPPYGKCQAIVSNVQVLKDEKAEIASKRAELISLFHTEGIIDREKKEIPDIIEHLVIITSHNSAAHCDMKQGVTARWPGLRTTIIHASVQGIEGIREIPLAFQKAVLLKPDVIICGRGGGSETDLHTFNEELVARCFMHSEIPIISAIGHESDHSISDLVADYRAKTPTAAIEIAIKYTKKELLENIELKRQELHVAYEKFLDKHQNKLSRLQKHLQDTFCINLDHTNTCVKHKVSIMRESMDKLNQKWMFCLQEKNRFLQYDMSRMFTNTNYSLKFSFASLNESVKTTFMKCEHSIALTNKDLDTCSPIIPLKRGFAFVTKDGKSVNSVSNLNECEHLCVKFIDGNIDVVVKRCRTK